MISDSSLRILVDGDSSRVYRRGDKVTGRVILAPGCEESISGLSISFQGKCVTTSMGPLRQEYKEAIVLFRFTQDLLSSCQITPNKNSWTFNFEFPEVAEPKQSKLNRSTYRKSPHPLPPSFYMCMDIPGDRALVSYYLRATLDQGATKGVIKTKEFLPYHPTPSDLVLEPKVHSRALYAQTWKPIPDHRTGIEKAVAKLSRRNSSTTGTLRIVPTLHYPERISPGQNIPLYISLSNAYAVHPAEQSKISQCILDSVTVTISTHTSLLRSQYASLPESVMVKHVTCLSKTNIARPISFGTKAKLAHNFRLVDDVECVPSFKTYTIARRYDLTVAVGIKYEGREATVRCTTLLEILPRIPQELLPTMPEDEDTEIDPLPLYVPRAPSGEFAPDYESVYSMPRSPSSSRSLAYTHSRGSSIAPGD